ncbi:type III PLP-dependent enzyme [Streptosporangium sp. NPDC051022]|uniref:type III PLP-dependent enzyme n=1 Tax=Streptosporangium sp. NPDC051022 TaxID=3155752 RepID=UPI00341B45B6
MIPIPDGLPAHVVPDDLPAYVYDLGALDAHAAAVRAAMGEVEIYYAVKANPDPRLLRVLARHVDGFEVSSGGELAHVRALFPGMPVALGGPGKTDADLAADVTRLHVESPGELRRLLEGRLRENASRGDVPRGDARPGDARLGDTRQEDRRPVDVLLRVNLDVPVTGAALAMGGGATPFGMDPDGIAECVALLPDDRTPPADRPDQMDRAALADQVNRTDQADLAGRSPVRLRGIHAHLASGLDAPALLELARAVLEHARELGVSEINLGGGMAVSYADPGARFDWRSYGEGLAELRRPGEVLRIEPGRALTAYCGRYVTRVIDVKRVHGELFAVVAGGTHHLRTPAAKGHSQPLSAPGALPEGEPITIVGQLCTPKDVLARHVPVRLAVGDVVEFAMAGAYAWNISHHDFLMHPAPGFHYL